MIIPFLVEMDYDTGMQEVIKRGKISIEGGDLRAEFRSRLKTDVVKKSKEPIKEHGTPTSVLN